MWTRRAVVLGLLLAGIAPRSITRAEDPPYRAGIEKWRQAHEAALRADDGWLTAVGLSWLERGPNSAGSDTASRVALPASAPAKVGVFRFDGAHVTFEATDGAAAHVNGKTVPVAEIRADSAGAPDLVTVGSVTMFVIRRGDRYGVRIKDTESEARRAFTGLRWFAVDERFRVTAKFVPYAPPKRIRITNVLGDQQEMTSPGYVVFELEGREHRLDPVMESAGARQLFFIFRDATSGRETYPAGRFLYAPLPKDGEVVLDFNKAENPPCAFTAFATCPLPPQQNWLAARITAGEQYVRH
jgi:uncharacterized protein (DUF1684 family)